MGHSADDVGDHSDAGDEAAEENRFALVGAETGFHGFEAFAGQRH